MTRAMLLSLLVLVLWATPEMARADAFDVEPQATVSLVDKLTGPQMALAGGVAVVAVPLAFFGARFVGSLSPDLVGAALPAVLLFTLLPAAATAGMVAWTAHGRFWPAFGLGVGTQFLAFAAAALLDISAARPLALAVFSLIDAAALAAISVSSAHWFPATGGHAQLAHLVRAEADIEQLKAPLSVSNFSMAF